MGFSQQVRLKQIIVGGPIENGPRTVKLFCNKGSFGFDDAESTKASQTFTLQPSSSPPRLTLDQSTFRVVTSLSVFIEDNHEDGDVTRLTQVKLFGIPIDTTNMNDLKK